MRRRRVVLPALLLLLMACERSGDPSDTTEPIKVAALYNLSGGMASLDRPSLNGLRLFVEQLNAGGGLLGGRPVELLVIDSKTDQREAATAARRAASTRGIVAAIGHNDSTFVLASAPLFQAAGIPFITPGATAPTLPEDVGDRLFMVPFGDDRQAHAMADYASRALGLGEVAVWTDNAADFTKGLSRFFQERFIAQGGRIGASEVFSTGDKDYSAQVARLKRADPAALYVAALPDEAALIIRQVREAGLALPILGGDSLDSSIVFEGARAVRAKDVYFTTHAFVGSRTAAAAVFKQAYLKKYGVAPENAFAPLGHDAGALLADAISRAASVDPDEITAALASTRELEVLTGTITYEPGRRVPQKDVAIMSIVDGAPVMSQVM